MNRALLFFKFLLLFVVLSSHGDEIRYAGEVIHLPVGSDVSAMGDAGVSLPRSAVSAYWNPASACMVSDYELSVEYANLFWGLAHHGAVAINVPIQSGDIGVSALWIPFYSGAIAQWDTLRGTFQERLHDPSLRADGSVRGYFHNTHNIFLFSLSRMFSIPLPRSSAAAFPLSLDIGTGVNFRGLWQMMSIDEKIRVGMNATLDAGFLMRFGMDYDLTRKEVSRHLILGISLRNIIPSRIMWNQSDDGSGQRAYEEPLHGIQHFGISYSDFTGLGGADWTISASLHRDYSLTYHCGIEGVFWNAVAFRAGLSDRVPTLGACSELQELFS